MQAKLNMQEVSLADIRPAEYNPRIELRPGDPDYEKIRRSIEEFSYVDPIIVNSDGTIIAGHQRYNVLRELGYETADVVIVDKTKDEEKALNAALNKISGEWDEEKLCKLLSGLDLSGMDMQVTGFTSGDLDELKRSIGNVDVSALGGVPEHEHGEPTDADWFAREEKDGGARQEGNEEYNRFVEKFEVKKTTDDCYTPDLVYDAVAGWVAEEYGLDRADFCRPFYPGGDYERFDYSGKIVVDNPPFSILASVRRFYMGQGIKYFLFAPALTLFAGADIGDVFLAAYCDVTYENGALVKTSFITNLEDGSLMMRTVPELTGRVDAANRENLKFIRKHNPKYDFPDYVLTAAKSGYFSHYGIDFRLSRSDCRKISQLDSMKELHKEGIFGGAFLLSEKAAAEKAAAEKAASEKAASEKAASEKAAAEKYRLSEREMEIVRSLGTEADDGGH